MSTVDVLLNLLTSMLGRLSQQLAAVSAVDLRRLKFYNCAVLPRKFLLFSAYSLHPAAVSAVDFLSEIND